MMIARYKGVFFMTDSKNLEFQKAVDGTKDWLTKQLAGTGLDTTKDIVDLCLDIANMADKEVTLGRDRYRYGTRIYHRGRVGFDITYDEGVHVQLDRIDTYDYNQHSELVAFCVQYSSTGKVYCIKFYNEVEFGFNEKHDNSANFSSRHPGFEKLGELYKKCVVVACRDLIREKYFDRKSQTYVPVFYHNRLVYQEGARCACDMMHADYSQSTKNSDYVMVPCIAQGQCPFYEKVKQAQKEALGRTGR